MSAKIINFLTNEDGAVTVDWVVLTAGIISLAIIVVASIRGDIFDTGNDIGVFLSDVDPCVLTGNC